MTKAEALTLGLPEWGGDRVSACSAIPLIARGHSDAEAQHPIKHGASSVAHGAAQIVDALMKQDRELVDRN